MGLWYLLAFVSSVALGVSSSLTLTDPRNSFTRFQKWDASHKGSLLRFRFKTYLADCLLLYQDSGKGRASEILAVELAGGKLSIFSVYPGTAPRTVKIGERLNDLMWHAVALERINEHTVNISLDGVREKALLSYEKSWKAAPASLYFGGLPSTDLGGQTYVFPAMILKKNRFVGCVEGPEFSQDSEGPLKDAILLDYKGIVNGCTDFCDKGRHCQNEGQCVNMFTTAECDCRHTAFEGSHCQHESAILNLQSTDYVTYQIPPATTLQDRVTFRFKTSKSDGVFLETSFYHDFLVVEFKSGSVHVTWNLGAQDLAVSTGNRTYDDDTWHFIDIRRNLRHISLSADDELCMSKTFPGRFVGLDMKGGEVLIGGVNNARSRMTMDKQNFQGCLQKLTFNGVDVLRGLKTGIKGYSLNGSARWNCEGAVATATVRGSTQSSGNMSTLKPRVLWEKMSTGSKQDVSPRTPCAVDDEDCISVESATGSGEELSGDSGGGESGSGSGYTTATRRPTVTSSPQGTFSKVSSPTPCSSDDEDCGGSGEGIEGGSGWVNKTTSLPTSQSVRTSSVNAANGKEAREENQVPAIASVAVVSFLLVAFLVFVGIWCYKHGGKGYTLSHKKMSVTLNP